VDPGAELLALHLGRQFSVEEFLRVAVPLASAAMSEAELADLIDDVVKRIGRVSVPDAEMPAASESRG